MTPNGDIDYKKVNDTDDDSPPLPFGVVTRISEQGRSSTVHCGVMQCNASKEGGKKGKEVEKREGTSERARKRGGGVV